MSGGLVFESVKLVNFGSHAARTWEPGTARLTVVTGPNGAGKSTLLVDGPLFALFGEVPGGYSPDQLVRIGSTDMSVTVELLLDGQRYRIIRRRTTRAGGKSSADLQARAPDGSWSPVATGAREVTAAVTRLLRMDHSTFRTAVVLAQGDAQRFMNATAGKGTPTEPGRAAVLSTLVVDPRFAAAEVDAREKARDVEAELANGRRALEALNASLARRPGHESALSAALETEAIAVRALLASDEARAAAEERLRELAGEEADARAAADELARLEGDLVALRGRYTRAKEAADGAGREIGRLTALAAAAVPDLDLAAAQGDVDALEAAIATEREKRIALETAVMTFLELEATQTARVSAWRAKAAAAGAIVDALEDQARALEPVTCPKCHNRFPADPGDIEGRLTTARAGVRSVGPEPAEPTELSRSRAARSRAETHVHDALVSPMWASSVRGALAAAQDAERLRAARTAAQDALEAQQAALARANAELADVDATGRAVATSKTAARARADAGAIVTQKLTAAQQHRAAAVTKAGEARTEHEQALRISAAARAALERLEGDQRERDGIAAGVAVRERELFLLRRLMAAFGVKGIPARVVESVLPELVAHANEMLGQLRPGMTLDVRATRAKADGSGTIEALDIWIQDRHGERQRWSGGEATSIAMSIAIALSRLGARRSGARVATLVIDEPDGLDSQSRVAFGQALRVLAHRGDLERVAVITHQDGIPDFADDVVEIEQDEEPSGSGVVAA
jgi:exonuclease SbcC